MKYLKISNKGLLDIRLIALMGGTTKAGNYHKIGHFGTGLKYTLAFLFRNKIDFKIFVGAEEVKVHIEEEQIGETLFEIICINGHRTSITTQMGEDWKTWMIIRELYSNALDEGGANHVLTEEISGMENETSFFIEFTPKVMEVYNNWNEFFLVDREPFYSDDKMKIYPQSGPLKLYKQGILIKAYPDRESLFNYDITHAEINELREYKGSEELDICKSIMNIGDKKVIEYFIENIKEEHYESKVDYDYWSHTKFNGVWEETLKGCKIIHTKAVEQLEAKGIEVDKAANITVPKKLYAGLTKQIDGIGALRVSKAVNDFFEIYDEKLDDKVKQAIKLLEDTDYYIDPELTFCYGVFGNKQVMAKVDLDQKKIFISEKHLDTDLFSVMTMLVEENEHYKTGFSDHTREFQQHFIDMYVNQLVEKAKVDLL